MWWREFPIPAPLTPPCSQTRPSRLHHENLTLKDRNTKILVWMIFSVWYCTCSPSRLGQDGTEIKGATASVLRVPRMQRKGWMATCPEGDTPTAPPRRAPICFEMNQRVHDISCSNSNVNQCSCTDRLSKMERRPICRRANALYTGAAPGNPSVRAARE